MLNGIPTNISPIMMKTLMEMGHGDEILLADSHFPAYSCNSHIIESYGNSILELLSSMLPFFPIDTYEEFPITLMKTEPGDEKHVPVWEKYDDLIHQIKNKKIPFQKIARDDFYRKTKNTFGIISTSETSQYANIILKKGVVGKE